LPSPSSEDSKDGSGWLSHMGPEDCAMMRSRLRLKYGIVEPVEQGDER
jgi:hypothetical protein